MATEATKESWRKASAKYRSTEKGKVTNAKSRKKYVTGHPSLVKSRIQDWYTRNPGKRREYDFKRAVTRHKITVEQYELRLANQGGVCAICSEPPDENCNLCIDHDHICCPGHFSCGQCIRGLIHNRCNKAIGFLRDSPKLVMRAYEYLIKEGSKLSSFRQQETSINDAKCLEDTLKSMGHKPVVSNEKQAVRGHYNETRKAEIILKKEDLKEGGDVGFSKDSKGNFSIIADTYVMRNGFNLEKFTKEVKQKYAETKIRKQAAQAGLTFIKKIDTGNGAFKLQFVQA